MKGRPDTIDIIEQKRLQWYGHVKRMPEERIPKLIMDWIPRERRKRECSRKLWMEGIQATMTKRKQQEIWNRIKGETQWNGVWFPEDGDGC